MKKFKNALESKLNKFGIPLSVTDRYDEPHRFYHNWDHIQKMLIKADEYGYMSDELFLAIIFHDIVYDPKASDNEEQSAELFLDYCLLSPVEIKNKEIIAQAILDTKTHQPTNGISHQLTFLDLEILMSPLNEFMEFEEKIFKEYQFVDYKIYKEARMGILKDLNVKPEIIEYIGNRKPNIALYAGSFNPFHKGHLNILEKAEKIFDKVIIAKGQNPDKPLSTFEVPSQIQNRQIVTYNGMLTDFIKNLGYDVTLIRGLRNATDLQFELTQYRYFQDFMPDIKIVSIFCDKEYEHISSSAIRQLDSLGQKHNYTL